MSLHLDPQHWTPTGPGHNELRRAAQRAAFRYSAFTSLTLVSGGVMGCAPAAPKGVGGGSPEGVTAGRPSSFTPIGVRSLGVVGYVEMMGVVWQSNITYINIIKLYQIMMFWNTIASWIVLDCCTLNLCLPRSVVAVYCEVFCQIEASTDARGVCACSPQPNHMCGIWTDPRISKHFDGFLGTNS